MYALYRLLAAGHRVVYDPGTYVFHRHRRDPAVAAPRVLGLRGRAVGGHDQAARRGGGARRRRRAGCGCGASTARPCCAGWLGKAERAPRAGGVGLPPRRLLGPGGLAGGAPRARRRAAGGGLPRDRPDPVGAAARAHPGTDAAPAPALSVVVPTVGRPERARALPRGAWRRSATRGPWRSIVVDDGVPPTAAAPRRPRPDRCAQRRARRGRRPQSRRPRGSRSRSCCSSTTTSSRRPISSPGTSHATTGGPRAVVGLLPARPARRRASPSRRAALWWHDHFELMADSARLTFTGMLSGNLSISRAARSSSSAASTRAWGGCAARTGCSGSTALEAGLELTYAPDAVAVHEFRLPVRRRLAGRVRRGPRRRAADRPATRAGAPARPRRAVRAACGPRRSRCRAWTQVAARPRAIATAAARRSTGLERARMRRRLAARLPSRAGGCLRGGPARAARRRTAERRRSRGCRSSWPSRTRRCRAPRAFADAVRAARGRTAAASPSCPITAAGTARWPAARRDRGRAPPQRQRAGGAAAERARRRAAAARVRPGPSPRRGRPACATPTLRIARAGGDHHWDGDRRAVRAPPRTHVVAPDAARGADARLVEDGRRAPRRRPRRGRLRRQRSPALGGRTRR